MISKNQTRRCIFCLIWFFCFYQLFSCYSTLIFSPFLPPSAPSLPPFPPSLPHLGVDNPTGLAARALRLHLIPTQDLGKGLAHLTAVGVLHAHKEELERSGGSRVRHAAVAGPLGGLAKEGGRGCVLKWREWMNEK